MQNLISRKDAAEILGISVKTLDQARLNGLIAYVQFVENGCVYFTETAIDEYMPVLGVKKYWVFNGTAYILTRRFLTSRFAEHGDQLKTALK